MNVLEFRPRKRIVTLSHTDYQPKLDKLGDLTASELTSRFRSNPADCDLYLVLQRKFLFLESSLRNAVLTELAAYHVPVCEARVTHGKSYYRYSKYPEALKK